MWSESLKGSGTSITFIGCASTSKGQLAPLGFALSRAPDVALDTAFWSSL